jgi:protein MpaA
LIRVQTAATKIVLSALLRGNIPSGVPNLQFGRVHGLRLQNCSALWSDKYFVKSYKIKTKQMRFIVNCFSKKQRDDQDRQHAVFKFFLAMFCITAIMTAGCQRFRSPEKISTIPYPETVPDTLMEQDEPEPVLSIQRYLAGYSAENRPIEYLLMGDGDGLTFILAAIHGNETGGIHLINYLLRYIQTYPVVLKNRKLLVVPVANPDGVANNTRHNARGIDLNRNFMALNRINSVSFGDAALSEPESRILHQLIWDYFPERIISIHEGDNMECIDYDGPAEMLANRMAEYCGLFVRKLGARPGSLGSYMGESLKIPTITFELPLGSGSLHPSELWILYGRALLASVLFPDFPEDYPDFRIEVTDADSNNAGLNNMGDF